MVAILGRGRADFCDQSGDVLVRLGEKVESTHLRPDGVLEKFGGRQTSSFHEVVQVVR